MNILMAIHIGAGLLALPSGTIAVVARKGGRLHARSGTLFFASMLVLGITAAILEPFRTPPGSPIAGIFVCYFVATSWVAARRRDGTTGKFEIVACAAALGTAALMAWGAIMEGATTPAGPGVIYALARCACSPACSISMRSCAGSSRQRQRIARHLWRMCFAFFIATGSFFLGQQDVLPEAVRGSPVLFVLAFAPFASDGLLAGAPALRKGDRPADASRLLAHGRDRHALRDGGKDGHTSDRRRKPLAVACRRRDHPLSPHCGRKRRHPRWRGRGGGPQGPPPPRHRRHRLLRLDDGDGGDRSGRRTLPRLGPGRSEKVRRVHRPLHLLPRRNELGHRPAQGRDRGRLREGRLRLRRAAWGRHDPVRRAGPPRAPAGWSAASRPRPIMFSAGSSRFRLRSTSGSS